MCKDRPLDAHSTGRMLCDGRWKTGVPGVFRLFLNLGGVDVARGWFRHHLTP